MQSPITHCFFSFLAFMALPCFPPLCLSQPVPGLLSGFWLASIWIKQPICFSPHYGDEWEYRRPMWFECDSSLYQLMFGYSNRVEPDCERNPFWKPLWQVQTQHLRITLVCFVLQPFDEFGASKTPRPCIVQIFSRCVDSGTELRLTNRIDGALPVNALLLTSSSTIISNRAPVESKNGMVICTLRSAFRNTCLRSKLCS